MKKRPFDVGIVFGDIHIPYHDDFLIDLLCTACKEIKPDFVVLNGDGFDFYQISQFSKDPRRKLELADDRIQFVRVMKRINKALPKGCVKHYLAGNHEARMQKFLWDKAPELAELDELETGAFLKLKELGWDYNENQGRRLPRLAVGRLTITHGHIVRKHSGYSARAMLMEYGESLLHNHTHRLGSHWRSDLGTTHVAFENGHLFQADKVDYIAGAVNWQAGFSVVTVDTKTGWFRVDQVPIVKVPGKPIRRMMLHEGVYECGV